MDDLKLLTHIILAHQYLFHVLKHPIWSNEDYDAFCATHNIKVPAEKTAMGYTLDVINLAWDMKMYPRLYPAPPKEEVGKVVEFPEVYT